MKINYKTFVTLLLFIIAAVIFQSCVNYDQKTAISKDGSGTMKIHYWTQINNVSWDMKLGNFDFDEQKIADNYTSSSTSVSNLTVQDELSDSTKHVNFDLNFNDIRKLSQAKGFKDIMADWSSNSTGWEFKYIQMKDTAAANKLNAHDYKITYTFEMPGEIISTNASFKEGNILTWQFVVGDLKEDLEMNAKVSFMK